jgi:hypothetical protein
VGWGNGNNNSRLCLLPADCQLKVAAKTAAGKQADLWAPHFPTLLFFASSFPVFAFPLYPPLGKMSEMGARNRHWTTACEL